MSSIRKSVPTRSYRERAQPLSRASAHPLLEKKRDYRLRARDHAAKQTTLKNLRARAAERNPDEFAFGMTAQGARAGGAKKRGAANTGGALGDEEEGGRGVAAGRGLSVDTVKLLKTQDAGYLRVARARMRRARERLEGILDMDRQSGDAGVDDDENEDDVDDAWLDGELNKPAAASRKKTSAPTHTIFVDDAAAQAAFDAVSHFDTTTAGLQRKHNRPRQAPGGGGHDDAHSGQGRNSSSASVEKNPPDARQRRRARERRRLQISALRVREAELAKAQREVDEQRARLAGTPGGGRDKNGRKFQVKKGRKK